MAAEEALRAAGLTGPAAFHALTCALQVRLGAAVEAHPVAARAIADVPLDGPIDLLGLAYERFFPDLFKGARGQYFTPGPLVHLALWRLGDLEGREVLDPTCGSGGFLVQAARSGASVRGIERDPLLADLARLNLTLAGHEARVQQADFFAAEPDPVEILVANPPFSMPVTEPATLERYELGRDRPSAPSDWLFLEAIERWVRPGGRAAIVLPWSLVANTSTAVLRARIDAAWRREAVCALPEGVFRPFGGAAGRACLLWLKRAASPARMAWSVLRDPGYDPRSRSVRPTSGPGVHALCSHDAWTALPEGRWLPAVEHSGRRLGEVARLAHTLVRPKKAPEQVFQVVDLADSDRRTGEIPRPRPVSGAELRGPRLSLETGQVVVSRLRPELGNVAVVPAAPGPILGSPEWIPLHLDRHAHYALHALRTPIWRAALPIGTGQTRPRVDVQDVLDSHIPWPSDELADRVDAWSRRLHAERAQLLRELEDLQALVDAHAAGALDADELERALDDRGVPAG